MEDKTTVKSESKEFKCSELESKCVELESEIERKKTEHEKLEASYRELEAEKNVIEEELNALKREKKGNEMSTGKEMDKVVDLTEEGDGEEYKVVQLMIENKVLECEKRRAESEVEILKQKLKKFESRVLNEPIVLQTGEGEKGGIYLEFKTGYGGRVRKPLIFEEDRSPNKKMAPSTPSGARSASLGVIDICDSDDEPEVTHVQPSSVANHENGNTCISTDHSLEGIVGDEKEIMSKESPKRFQRSYEENLDDCSDSVPFICTPKRKRASNIVTSDTESDDDDVPICKIKRMNIQEKFSGQPNSKMKSCSVTAAPSGDDNIKNDVTPTRRRLVSLRNCSGKSFSSKTHETKCQRGIPTTEDVEDDESEHTGSGSESEGESLNGFIVDSGEELDLNDTSSEVDDSDDNVDFDEILSTLNRSKDQKLEWDFEAEMLAAFGKDPELCMKAVCTLYRQQTSEEKVSRGTLVYNYRGFSKFDARRGTTLAEFLTDGDPRGALKKSVEDLHMYDRKAVEMCRTLATRYSKQLFEIYKNNEDPLFP